MISLSFKITKEMSKPSGGRDGLIRLVRVKYKIYFHPSHDRWIDNSVSAEDEVWEHHVEETISRLRRQAHLRLAEYV